MRKPCCDKKDVNKGAWTKQEDDKLIEYIRKHGEGCWRKLPQAAGLVRCGKSCRLRWINYLRPDLKRGNFDEDEEDLIIKLHALLGNRWSLIAGRLPGRTDNEVKNYWNSHLRRKLIKMGIDPNHHKLSCLNLTRSHNPEISSSISSKTPTVKHESPKSNYININNVYNYDDDKAASEDTSCLLNINEISSNNLLPDLNRDLTITINHSSAASQSTNEIFIKDSQKENQSLISKDLEFNIGNSSSKVLLPLFS